LISDDLLQETEGEIRANRRVTIKEFHHVIPEVSKTTILKEKLGYRKLCARWVPKILTDYHKTKRMGFALKFLTRYTEEGDEFLGLFLHLKKHLGGKQFDDDDEVQEKCRFKVQAADFYDSGIQKPVPRLNKCLENAGDHVEK
jgi:hypothetical protein